MNLKPLSVPSLPDLQPPASALSAGANTGLNSSIQLKSPQEIFSQDQFQTMNLATGSVPHAAPASETHYVNFSSMRGTKLDIPLYTSYGTPQSFSVKGRVIEAEASDPSVSDNWLDNLRRTAHQLKAEDKQNLWVDITVLGQIHRVKTDHEGFFELKLSAPGLQETGYLPVQAQLVPGQKHYYSLPSLGKVVLQNPAEMSRGVISDIDDTIQVSHAVNKTKMMETLLFKNPYTQQPVPGMAEFLTALDRHADGKIDGDVNYVSGSPLNIAPRLETFLTLHGFPEGAMDLKYMGLGAGRDNPTEQFNYKLGKIRTLFETYPNRSFVLVGDSGEKDPEVYREIALEFPGRVQAVYIHNVTGSQASDARFQGMVLFDNADQAAADAAARGLISGQEQMQVLAAVTQAAPQAY
ncbi:hypothetical protein COW36_12125 [bacterium (Candidatus Blackallbacteria) CG17_big_fil_post_rev_8_21_14_2_50_48_46]|uniref:Phosphatidate phosphatase APP1 catalytic domain-containing protein n=1 Tax=bacterium (Candidatus Blackallbacteria) CG17_big_fil_post_rev_8_21_14_2_50_48_46 TaxID=2014261 RepID=A0A2M7G3Q7_9BACT|nr:MAG: hypothetical protein COW64_03135 [bacterium (Candidatus Blackallbacteria) CG18_big_fil_WC_8_21_14_2_50_49_26]PIW16506.1 MAG: hypothetical protein COW36_12125 [bacterium (Candidatus Blackallbacteria) CG17_big_fil_post_rev_8_21_14_2_50_48_46]PIW46014.1 MAG: hypothetical protein COW20_17390 [bacterium (Candidatus Blackallbacteria) CG13_big_fil_rev_8_21_14_2_50_49_14]